MVLTLITADSVQTSFVVSLFRLCRYDVKADEGLKMAKSADVSTG
jgi:hypothetical protein